MLEQRIREGMRGNFPQAKYQCPPSLKTAVDVQKLINSNQLADYLANDFNPADPFSVNLIAHNQAAAQAVIDTGDLLEQIASYPESLKEWFSENGAKQAMVVGLDDWTSSAAMDRLFGVAGAFDTALSIADIASSGSNYIQVDRKAIILKTHNSFDDFLSNYDRSVRYIGDDYYHGEPSYFVGWKFLNGFSTTNQTTIYYIDIGARTE